LDWNYNEFYAIPDELKMYIYVYIHYRVVIEDAIKRLMRSRRLENRRGTI
jgi:hypothetical protein